MKLLCFKPTRNVHESGYRYIEYGYMDSDDATESVEIIGRYDIITTPFDSVLPISLDLTRSGWFRILPRIDRELKWTWDGTIVINELAPKG